MGQRIAVLVAIVAAAALGGCGQAATTDSRHAHPRPGRPRMGAGHHATTTSARGPHRPVNVLAHLPPAGSRCLKSPAPVAEHPITHRAWLTGVTITEYYPAPERWFTGRRVPVPGLPGRHAVDWLYSARGLAMEGDGVDLSGRPVHIAALGSTGWVDFGGHGTQPVCLGKWSHGFPVWLKGGWRNAYGQVTFPLAGGGWANGPGTRQLDYGGVTFASGSPLPLRYYRSIAVDPGLIPLGSRVYIPAYRHVRGGWFVAQDTGGAIRGRHVDVYRPAPASPDDLGRYLTGQRILVIPPTG